MNRRSLCTICNQRPVGINYYKDDVAHYRRKCDVCSRQKKKLKPKLPNWTKSGYKKKPQCERCGFKAKLPEQLGVFYVDGNLKNNTWTNLKTVCLNCQQEIFKSNLPWVTDPLRPDF